jgi:uncharacterized protein (UPF0303 family)
MTDPNPQDLQAEVDSLILPHFDETTAFHLGSILFRMAQEGAMPVVINIRNASRCFFHAALPGSSGHNDGWARRKSNTALVMETASMVATLKAAAKGRSLADEGLAAEDYALSGGAVPLRVAGAGVVAVATVSGLPQLEDHRLVVRAIRELLADLAT